MKTTFRILIFTFLVALSTSCSKSLEMSIIGLWNIDDYSRNGASVQKNMGTYEFKDGGTGILTRNGATPTQFTWTSSTDQITMNSSNGKVVASVTTSEKTKLVWETKDDTNTDVITLRKL